MQNYQIIPTRKTNPNAIKDQKAISNKDRPQIEQLHVYVLDPTWGFCSFSAWIDVIVLWLYTLFSWTFGRFLGKKSSTRVNPLNLLGSLVFARPTEEIATALNNARDGLELALLDQDPKKVGTRVAVHSVNFSELEADSWFDLWSARLKVLCIF